MVSVPTVLESSRTRSFSLSFVSELVVTGASITASSNLARQSTACTSDPRAARVDALQLELGEGPRWEAFAMRVPVLCPDLTQVTNCSWPIFLRAAQNLGVGALFSFPMIMGAALVGVVDLYCDGARPADREFISQATLMAGRVVGAAVQKALYSAENHLSNESAIAPALRREIHQATGLILSQLNVTATEAFARLQAYAFASGQSMDHAARRVVERASDSTRCQNDNKEGEENGRYLSGGAH